MRGIRLLTVVLACALISGAVRAQVTPVPRDGQTALPIGTSSISGVVVTADGMRIARALVTLSNDRGGTKTVPTDANGAFSLTQIGPGTYELYATMPSFLTAYFGQT